MKRFLIIISAMLILVSCSKEDEQPEASILQGKVSGQVFYASVESNKQPITKVYADENMQVLWNEGDVISVFNKTTYNYQYLFTGEDGDNYGRFEEVPVTGLISGNNLNNIYAVYPYSKSNKVNNAGTAITMTLPAEQTYEANSFGIGANAMIAVTESNFLAFKNVCGYLSLRFYGDNVSISRITLKGNSSEKIAGKASIAVSTSTVPVTTMDDSATDAITLVCDPPVKIGSTAEGYTDFWFVIPPTTFSNGFTINVTDALGGTYEKTTTRSFTVTRNQMDWMNPLKVEVVYDEENTYVPFEDANFKAYCVANFDANNDGEISLAEAEVVERIECYTGTLSGYTIGSLDIDSYYFGEIYSLKGIEKFTNLKYLICSGVPAHGSGHYGYLTSLDLGANTLLETLDCSQNAIEKLDISDNLLLKCLNCSYNKLTSIDVSLYPEMTTLRCSNNQLTVLDVSNNYNLLYLDCSYNQITTLDTRNIDKITHLDCKQNDIRNSSFRISEFKNLTFLDVSNSPRGLVGLDLSNNLLLDTLCCRECGLYSLDLSANKQLKYLTCWGNDLRELNVSNNVALVSLHCQQNKLTSIDLSYNEELEYLNCADNCITSLNISNCLKLENLWCYLNNLSDLDLASNTALKNIYCSSNQLGSLDLGNCSLLSTLFCSYNEMESLDISSAPNLTRLCAWPQSKTFVQGEEDILKFLTKKQSSAINFYKSSKDYYSPTSCSLIDPSYFGTTIIEVE